MGTGCSPDYYGQGVALTARPYLPLKLKKEYSYTFTPFVFVAAYRVSFNF
jgi:hypothetical protein